MAADRIYTAQMRMTADVSEAKTQLENLQSSINSLLKSALTDKINDRETFMKGLDYSYYYEQVDQ